MATKKATRKRKGKDAVTTRGSRSTPKTSGKGRSNGK